MTDSLREELARRLSDIGDIPMSVGPQRVRKKIRMDRLADECIRQMEWARSHCLDGVTRLEESPSGEISAVKFENALTLAPPDWKPE